MVEVTSEVMVHMRHVRAAKLCARGSRAWVLHNGFDWNEFLTSGLPASALLATGDPIVARAVAEAQKEARDV
jgi:hypothetical protein